MKRAIAREKTIMKAWLPGLLTAWLPGLLTALALDASAAAQAGNSGAPSRGTVYRVTNLSGERVMEARINASGQVAFHEDLSADEDFARRGRFYDGSRFHDLGLHANGGPSITGLNDAGQVVGHVWDADFHRHGFVWSTAQRAARDLGMLPGFESIVYPAINGRGDITGYAFANPGARYRAFRWSAAEGMRDLGISTKPATIFSTGEAINDDGVIAGAAYAPDYALHAFVWTRAAGMADIDTMGNPYSRPMAIGADGQVAGNRMPADGSDADSVFVWTRARGMRAIGVAGWPRSWMTAMSKGGRISAVLTHADRVHAMTWTEESGAIDLGTLGGDASEALGANDRGQVVGDAILPNGIESSAFVWTGATGMIDLATRLRHVPAGMKLVSAIAIADNGAIVAQSNAGLVLLTPYDGRTDGVVAGPIDVPGALRAGIPFVATVGFVAAGAGTGHKVVYSWGDGSPDQTVDAGERNGDGIASAVHSYAAPGIFRVTANVVGQAGASAVSGREVRVFDAAGGMVAGSGVILATAPAGAGLPPDAGRAEFSFVVPGMQAADAAWPRGRMRFTTTGWRFDSKQVRLVARDETQGQVRARIAGNGSIDGKGDYRFAMVVGPGPSGGVARSGYFRLKIWHVDPVTKAESVDYDSQPGAPDSAVKSLAAGSIEVQ